MMATAQTDLHREWLEIHLRKWAAFVNDSGLRHLGFPSQAVTVVGGDSEPADPVWRERPKTTRSTTETLPEWKVELTVDAVVNDLNIEWQRVLYCHYQIRLKPEKVRECRITVRDMRLLWVDGRYDWPRYRKERIAALRIPERTFYRSLKAAMEAVSRHPEYADIT